MNPYPARTGEPVEICADVRNLAEQPRQGLVHFLTAAFGIAQRYTPIEPPVEIFIPELGLQRSCVNWIPAVGGQFAVEVQVETPCFPIQMISQRVIDASKVLVPGTISELIFPVRNPTSNTATITLGIIPFLPDLRIGLSQDGLTDMQPGEVRYVTLAVQFPQGGVLPPDLTPVVDVEAFLTLFNPQVNHKPAVTSMKGPGRIAAAWPKFPQHSMLPSLFSPQVCQSPVATWMKGPWRNVGACPLVLSPMQAMSPPFRTTQVCRKPELTWTNGPPTWAWTLRVWAGETNANPASMIARSVHRSPCPPAPVFPCFRARYCRSWTNTGQSEMAMVV